MPILTAADNLLLGATAVNRVYAGAKKVWPPNYLDAVVGSASTPDPGPLPAQCIWVYKVRNTLPVTIGVVAAQYEADPNRSWLVRRAVNGTITLTMPTSAGTSSGARTYTTSNVPQRLPTGGDEILANSFDETVATVRMWRVDATGAWVADASNGTVLSPQVTFDSTSVVRIGRFATSTPWIGRIYWVELRTGLDPRAGTLVWRFDASEYPGTGTTFTDARGRVWTLSAANSIVVP